MDEKDYAERLKTVGRNDPCPCGSGRKYKQCHLSADRQLEHEALTKAAEERAAAEAAADAEDAQNEGDKHHKTKAQAREDHHHHLKGGKGKSSSATLPRRGAI